MNSKPRFKPAPALITQLACRLDQIPIRIGGSSLTSERSRRNLVQKLKALGILNQQVLDVIATVPRHLFVDEGLASRAYEDAALPIGHQQTISRPFTVARFAEYALEGRNQIDSVLEVGLGCGYQAAVFASIANQVVGIERIEALHDKAQRNLNYAGFQKVKVIHGDGLLGLPAQAPFDIIIVAAAGLEVPQTLLNQLKVGGRLILPVADQNQQNLVVVDRLAMNQWHREKKDLVKFVPLLQGTRIV